MIAPNAIDQLIIEHYRRYLSTTGTCKSVSSIDDYLLSLEMFCREVGDNVLEKITEYRVFHWVIESLAVRTEWPDGRPKKVWGQRMTYKVASECCVFLVWAHSFSFTPHNPCKDGHLFKKGESADPEFFEWSSEEFQALYHHPANSVRDLAIIQALRASGLRVSEAAALKIKNVRLDECLFEVVCGKGGRPGFAPMDEDCQRFMQGYIAGLKKLGFTADDCLFPASWRSGAASRPLKDHSIWKMLSVRGKSLGIHAYPHKLRHSLAGELIDKGADLLTVSEVLRHKDLSTTRRYTHLRAKRMVRIYARTLKTA